MAINLNKIYLKLIDFHLDPFYKYAPFFEDNLQKEQEKVVEGYEDAIKKVDPSEEYYDVLLDSYREDYQIIADDFTYNFRSFLLTQIYSTVEFELIELCGRITGQTKKLSDYSGGYIDQAKAYLIAAGVNFDVAKDEWNHLLMMRRMRNAIIHKNGYLKLNSKDSTDKALKHFSLNGNFVKFEPDTKTPDKTRVVITSPETIILFLDKIRALFEKIIPQVKI
jgi:hypothetical protein